MYFFYVLYSLKDGNLYKGYSEDVGKRFIRHHAGAVKSTKNRRPLVLIYVETFSDKREALARERWSKKIEGGIALKRILIDKGILSNENRLCEIKKG